MSLPSPSRSRLVLIGVDAYLDADLPGLPAVTKNIGDLRTLLIDPRRGAFMSHACVAAPSDVDVGGLGRILGEAARTAEDLLLVYFAGHGLVGARNAELYLALHGTDPAHLPFTAMRYGDLRDVMLDARADKRVVILDCCYSGRAIGAPMADPLGLIMGQLPISGTYVLTACPSNRPAQSVPGEQHTAFTERLLRVLDHGLPDAGDLLSMGDIYRGLYKALAADGLPLPQQENTEFGDRIALIRNAYTEPWVRQPAGPVQLRPRTQPTGAPRVRPGIGTWPRRPAWPGW